MVKEVDLKLVSELEQEVDLLSIIRFFSGMYCSSKSQQVVAVLLTLN